jgi:cell division initiation protein
VIPIYTPEVGAKKMLTPLDIHNKEFKKGFRGYNEVEVDEFLDQVVRDYEESLRDNAELKSRIQDLEAKVQQYRSMEETLNNTLVVAQRTADEVKATSHREAEVILEKARLEAARALDDANQKMRSTVQDMEGIKKDMQAFKVRMRALLKTYADLLDGGDGEDLEVTKVV